MIFASREDAGAKLGHDLERQGIDLDLVLGLPRGGVVVAAEVAAILGAPLDVLVVRKIGHPQFREFALGALAEEDVVVLDPEVLRRMRIRETDLDDVIDEERKRLEAYRQKFAHPEQRLIQGRTVGLVDDGLATGATLEAAVRSVRKQGAKRIIAAVPVASPNGAERIAAVADLFYALHVGPEFEAVGQYYEHFGQTTDEVVLRALAMQISKPG